MREFFRRVARVFEYMETLEFAIPAILAALLIVFVPLLACFHFFRSHHYVATFVTAGLWILSMVVCIRDFRRRQLTWLPFTLGVVWLVVTGFVWWKLETL